MELPSIYYLVLCQYIIPRSGHITVLGMGEENYGPTRGNSRDTGGKDGNT